MFHRGMVLKAGLGKVTGSSKARFAKQGQKGNTAKKKAALALRRQRQRQRYGGAVQTHKCQLCGLEGHPVVFCRFRFNVGFVV